MSVTRVPPSTGPEFGVMEKSTGVRRSLRNVNAFVRSTRFSEVVPAWVMTMMEAASS
jgi:hypothetical protein